MPLSSMDNLNSLRTRAINTLDTLDAEQRAYYEEAYINAAARPFGITDFYQTDDRAAKAARTKARKKDEVIALERFMATGVSRDLKLSVDKHGKLRVFGSSLPTSRSLTAKLMFILDKRKITLHNKRSKHLIPLLTKLGEREGLRLNIVSQFPTIPSGVSVAFWPFNITEEVDDTEIVAQTQVRELEGTRPDVEEIEENIVWSRSSADYQWLVDMANSGSRIEF